jgi:hypothetical protein
MNIANEEFSEKLSLYVDGALPEQEAKEIESILEADASARRQADELRKLKALLSSREPLTPHAGLWTRVSLALDEEKKEEHNLLPFQRKHLPLVAGLVTAVFVAVGFIVMQNGMQLAQIISKGPGAVIDAVHNKNLQNSLLPLFASVDKDRALQFSLFGTLPLDKKSETALRVDENAKQGYRIDVGKELQSNRKPVTFDRFIAEIKPDKEQKRVIDSLLDLTSERIQSSVLIGDHNALAIAPDLPRLNRTMVTSIASCLEPPQRARFERLLAANDAPYAVAAPNAPTIKADKILRNLPRTPRTNRYVVITPDTMMYSQIHIDMDSLRSEMKKNLVALELRRNELLKKLLDVKFRHAPPPTQPQIPRIVENQNFFSIEINTPAGENDQQPAHIIVQHRSPRQIVFPEMPRRPVRIRIWNDSMSVDSVSIR